MKNMNDFLYLHKNLEFIVGVYKRVFTPYEVDKKFSDESVFSDSFKAYLVDFYELDKMGDYLLKFKRECAGSCDDYDNLDMCENDTVIYEFYRLSEVSLTIVTDKY